MKKINLKAVWQLAAIIAATIAISTTALAAHMDYLLLVNGDHGVASGYGPQETVTVSNYVPSTKTVVMQKEAGEKLIEMFAAIRADGITNLKAVSGYRSYSYQNTLHNNKIREFIRAGSSDPAADAARIVAPPGKSEHQTGLAIDLGVNSALVASFSQTEAGQWLKENSYKFGFILRYDQEKTEQTGIIFEPWHFRYVGSPHSYIIYRNGWCYEEYVEQLAAGEVLSIDASDNFVYEVFRSASPEFDMTNVLAWSEDNLGGYIVTRGYYKNQGEER